VIILLQQVLKSKIQQQGKPQTKRSGWWYLLPIFFSIIGGVIAYFVLKDVDKKLDEENND
jgi:hypothetical protein